MAPIGGCKKKEKKLNCTPAPTTDRTLSAGLLVRSNSINIQGIDIRDQIYRDQAGNGISRKRKIILAVNKVADSWMKNFLRLFVGRKIFRVPEFLGADKQKLENLFNIDVCCTLDLVEWKNSRSVSRMVNKVDALWITLFAD